MNTASVEQAYASDELPVGNDVKLSWADNDTRLLITPSNPLEYATIAGLGDPPKEYLITIAGTATDAAGIALGDDFQLPFYTLRDFTQDLGLYGGFELTHPHDGGADTSSQRCSLGDGSGPLSAGDDDKDVTFAFATRFGLSGLAEGIAEWKSATVQGAFTISAQNPFVDTRLGELWGYALLAKLADWTWSSPTRYIGSAAQFASQERFELDVRSYLAEYYENPPDYQFGILFKFEHDTNVDGMEQSLTTGCDARLHVEYLVP